MEKIIVVDFGGQYSHLIASCLRRLGVACELWQPETPIENFLDPEIKGIILSGGPASVYDPLAPPFDDDRFFERVRVPILGICYGHQLIAQHFSRGYFDAVVKLAGGGEYGPCVVKILYTRTKHLAGVLEGLNAKETVWMSHEDSVESVPPAFMLNASSPNSRCAAIRHIFRPIFGVQFHPEVTHTACGQKIFENFLELCQIKKEWTPKLIYDEARKILIEGVNDKYAVIFVSGGVDSSVLLELAKQNLPKERIFAIYIDTGLGEENEARSVKNRLTGEYLLELVGGGKLPKDVEEALIAQYQKTCFYNLRIVRARNRFFRALRKVYDPEEKRKIIGNLFVKIWQEEVKKLSLPREKCALLQGTIYPDTIEAARTMHSDKIKTHHNRVPQIKEIPNVVEPLQFFYKDEVRMLGKQLGVDESILSRHPRPGPGNAVRILCSEYNIWPPFDEKLKKALDAEMEIQALCQKRNLDATLLPIQSTGVQGDQRTYGYTIALRNYNREMNWGLFLDTASQITNSHKGIINRIVLTLWPIIRQTEILGVRKAYITKKRDLMLKKAETIVKKHLVMGNWYNFVWQFPVVLAPISFDMMGESIILRPIDSVNAMTASVHKLPWPMVENIVGEILAELPEIQAIFYDLTSKPPATIEWE